MKERALERMACDHGPNGVNCSAAPAASAAAAAPGSAPTPPRIICQMRIKNEARWLREVLDSIARVAAEIVVLDDGSTDETPEICRVHRSVVDYRRQEEATVDEVRDKNRLLRMALARNPEWILCMDGDEVLEDSAPERIAAAVAACPADVAVLDVQFLYMWGDRQHHRTDGIYRRIFHHRLFRVNGQDRDRLAFAPTAHGGNFHCESVPPNLRGSSREIDVKVKHLGYMLREDRERKHRWYRAHDPSHAARGYYDHLLDQPGMTIEEWRERPFSPVGPPSRAACAPDGVSPKQERKPALYYANVRRNAIDLVPGTARRVLDVGCGKGLTGDALRNERGIEVVGIEFHAEIAQEAREHLDQVLVGDVEIMDLPFPDGHFDCILLLDVLEHLVDPWRTLSRLVRCLHPAGRIVASIPNVRNLAVIRQVMDGSFRYQEQGILDRTHLRFFARADMEALFEQAGLEPRIAEIVVDPAFQGRLPAVGDRTIDLTIGNMVVRGLTSADLDELTAQQFLFVAARRAVAASEVSSAESPPESSVAPSAPTPQAEPEAGHPLVSVVIPVHGNLAYTRQCLDSIAAQTEPFGIEVIVVDDASRDDTAEFLRGLGDQVRTVTNPRNLGFARSCNAGARVARGQYLVFLNNDTIVQEGWLTGMLDGLRSHPGVGLVGNLQVYPDTGLVQHAGIVCGPNRVLYSIYNGELRADHPAVCRARELQFVAGSCMLLERAFFLSLGGFDEAYLNSCEDVDLCMKVRAAGRKVMYAPASRIFHFESRTVKGHSKGDDNYRRFLERWGKDLVQDDHLVKVADGQAKVRRAAPRRAPRVALIAPPRNFKQPQVSSYSGFSKNLGIGYVAATLRKANVEVSVLDAFALGIERFERCAGPRGEVYRCGLSYAEIADWVQPGTEIIGISVPFSNVAPIAFELAAFLKRRHPAAQIVLGGVHPSTFPAESLRDGIDGVIAGEGEDAMVALARGEPPETIPGYSWRDARGEIHVAQRAACVTDLDSVPFPAWDLLPMERYLTRSPRGDGAHRALSLVTSRGCPFACSFCSIHPVSGRKWRARSPENVLAEIRLAREKYGIDHLEIEDDNFTLDRERALAILRGIRSIHPGMTWAAHNGVRIDTLDEELLTAIRDSGCTQLNLAIEHGSPSVLAAMDKRLSLEKVRKVVAGCGRLRIPTLGFCLVGHPGETDAAFAESFRFFRELRKAGLSRIAPFIVNAYPGTRLQRDAAARGWLTPGADRQLFFIEDEFVSVVTPDFDEATVLARKTCMEFLNVNPDVDPEHVLARLAAVSGSPDRVRAIPA